MGTGRADDPASQARRTTARREPTRSSQRGLLCARTGCQRQALPKDLPPKTPRIIISRCGTGTARWSASMRRSMSRHARPLDAKQVRRRRSSTRRAPRPLKKALGARPAGLRRGQEGRGPQASYPCRHARLSPARREGFARRRSRPRRAHDLSLRQALPPSLTLHRAHLCLRRISGAQNCDDNRRHGMLDDGDRSALRSPSFRRFAEAMDRRAQARLDKPQPAS